MENERTRITRARKLAKQQGFILTKSRAVSFGNFGMFMITDVATNTIVAGSHYDLSLNDVEAFLKQAS